MNDAQDPWLAAVNATISSYRRMIDAAVQQLSDEELTRRPDPQINSVAVVLRHLGGNLQSRWTDFLTTDGEKPNRDRDSEFLDWPGDRQSLLAYFDAGWSKLLSAVEAMDTAMFQRKIFIRGEAHTVADALVRSLVHIGYHAGQICMIARMVHAGKWQWLSIPPGQSLQHNQQTWGSASSRCVLGDGKPQN